MMIEPLTAILEFNLINDIDENLLIVVIHNQALDGCYHDPSGYAIFTIYTTHDVEKLARGD